MHVLLYYKYTDIEDPEDLKEKQKIICERLGITGRILIAEEGINGTVGGTFEALDQYMSETMCYPGLSDIEWKISEGNDQTFPKLRVVVRPEVVTLGLKERGKDVSLKHKAHYIEPDELLRLYESGEEFTIIDARNEYEGRIGKFKDAIVPDIDNFREFPEFVASIEHLKNKPVVTYCTGGIRCEKHQVTLKNRDSPMCVSYMEGFIVTPIPQEENILTVKCMSLMAEFMYP